MDVLSNLQWEYIILDEGHKIRNPDAKITLAVRFLHLFYLIIIMNGLRNLNFNYVFIHFFLLIYYSD